MMNWVDARVRGPPAARVLAGAVGGANGLKTRPDRSDIRHRWVSVEGGRSDDRDDRSDTAEVPSATADSMPDAAGGPSPGRQGGANQSDGAATAPVGGTRPLISFVIPSLTVGGAEQVTVSIVNDLATRGYAVELVVAQFDGKLRSALRADVEVVELSPSRTPGLGVAAEFGPIVRYLREAEPAALFPHLPRMSVVCLAAAQVAGTDTAVFPTHHSAYGQGPEDEIKARVVDWLVKHLYPTADRVIAVSDGVADGIARLTAVDRADISVLHNPVDVGQVRARACDPVDDRWIEDDKTPVVLFVGRLVAQKDLETWLWAFSQLHERDPDVRGVVAGQGPQRKQVSEVVADLGLQDVVAIPGYVDNPFRYMSKADLFLMSSRYEGLPTVLIEALACGCPVVSTDCPNGPREILADSAYGRLVPVGDHEALAAAAAATLADPPASDRLQARADDFAPAVVMDDYERFIQKYVLSA